MTFDLGFGQPLFELTQKFAFRCLGMSGQTPEIGVLIMGDFLA